MKTNPCTLCLVKPCCTNLCNEKSEYTEQAIAFLCRLGKIVYKNNGKLRRNLSNLTLCTYKEAVKVCAENNKETNKIFNNHIHSVIN